MKTKNINQQTNTVDQETIKFFALEEFKNALFKQEFEQCQTLINNARQVGVLSSEIQEVIDAFIKKRQ